jgi:chromosome segregation ATPase
VTISIDTLKAEREALKDRLRQLEAEQRKVEAELKGVRQLELRAKREIEALSTLIELAEIESKNETA